MADRVIAELHLLGERDLAGIAKATAARAATALGLDASSAAELADATRVLVDAVATKAFDEPSERDIDVTVVLREGAVAVLIDDLGLPFAFHDEADAFEQVLTSGWVDEAHQTSRGVAGNRTELVRHLDHEPHDIRVTADPAEHADAHAAPPVASTAEVIARRMEPGDAEGLARLTWRTYGYSYEYSDCYRPDVWARMVEDGTSQSWVGVTPDGEIVGHMALVLERPDSVVAEWGRGMVDPRYRGHHVLKTLDAMWRASSADQGLYGRYADFVTAHTRSQSVVGGAEQPSTGLLLGFLPPTVTFRRMRMAASPRRQAVAMGYEPLRPHPELVVYPPVVDRDVVRRIYDAHGVPRPFGDLGPAPPSGASSVETQIWRDLGAALFIVHEPGADLRDAVRARLRSTAAAGIEVVYADLPLAHPGTAAAAETLATLGFHFGGVIPLLRDGSDALRYQRAPDLDVDTTEIHLLGDMARDLLDYVLARRDAVG